MSDSAANSFGADAARRCCEGRVAAAARSQGGIAAAAVRACAGAFRGVRSAAVSRTAAALDTDSPYTPAV